MMLLLVAIGLIFSNSGCTSKKADDSQLAIENADVEKIETEGFADGNSQTTDPSLDQALNETTVTTTATTEEVATTEAPPPTTVDAVAAPADAGATATTDASAAAPAEGAVAVEATPADGAPQGDVSSQATATTTESEITETPVVEAAADSGAAAEPSKPVEVAAKPKATGTLKKISESVPYQHKDGGFVNTVYVARPKEKLLDISMKIFGTDKTAELKQIAENSYLKSRGVKSGDKIYYVSPNRPDDSAKTMIYYEDIGMVPETYVTKKDENLKKVAKNLLKYDDAWKEVWTSNTIESKTTTKDGEILRYWKNDSAAVANNAPPAQQSGNANLIDASQAPQQQEAASLPPPPADAAANLPPPPDVAANTPPPPADLPAPPTDTAAASTQDAAGSMEPPPPPPPPPPVEDDAMVAKKKVNLDEAAENEGEEGSGMDDTMMSIGALGILVALLAVVIIRKKKQKAAAAAAAAAEMADNNMEVNA